MEVVAIEREMVAQHTLFFLLVFWRMLDILRFLRHEWWCRVHGDGIGLCVSPYRCLFVAPMNLPASWLHRDQLSQTEQAVSHGSLYQEFRRSCISMKAASLPTKRLRSMVENCFVSWDILRAWSFHFKLHVAEGGLTVGMMSCTNRFFKSHLESSRRICFGEANLRAIIIHIYIHDLQSPVLLCFVGHPSLHYLVNLFAFLSTQICFSLQFLHLNINIHIH